MTPSEIATPAIASMLGPLCGWTGEPSHRASSGPPVQMFTVTSTIATIRPTRSSRTRTSLTGRLYVHDGRPARAHLRPRGHRFGQSLAGPGGRGRGGDRGVRRRLGARRRPRGGTAGGDAGAPERGGAGAREWGRPHAAAVRAYRHGHGRGHDRRTA